MKLPHRALPARHLLGPLLLALALGPTAARAADDGYGTDAADAGGFTLSYGAAITSEYISDGVTQSNGNPALQGYVEGSYGIFFAGIWSSTVDFEGGDDNVEFDLYAGVRQEFGDLELALSYYRYIYDQTGDCCGEFLLEAEYALSDAFGTGLELSWDPDEEAAWAALGLSYAFAEKWTLESSIGTDFGTESEAEEEDTGLSGRDKVAMEFGISRALTDNAQISLVYHDSNQNPEALVVTLSADF